MNPPKTCPSCGSKNLKLNINGFVCLKCGFRNSQEQQNLNFKVFKKIQNKGEAK